VVAVVAFPPIDNAEAVPVMFVPTRVVGVPKFGVTKVGLVANTAAPDPVSSLTAVANCAEVIGPNDIVFVAPTTPTEIPVPAATKVCVKAKLKLVPSQYTELVTPLGMDTLDPLDALMLIA
jgi:hypothetical protein